MSTAEAVIPTEDTRTVRQALRRLKGTATVGDVSSATGLSQARTEEALTSLLEMHRGHLEVGERGDLVYRFDPGMIRRDAVPFMTRLREGAWSIFKTTFKVVIAVVLVVYAVIFLALMIAALLANRDGDGDFGGGGDRRGGRGHFPSFWLWYWLWSPRWGWGRPYYGDYYGQRQGARRRGERPEGPPFYKKVFAFVFGPDEPELTQERKDRELLRFIRARQGAVSAADLVQATGMTLENAESELARLMAAHDGEVEVTRNGTLVYLFPSLMVSAAGPVEETNLPAAWRRLEPPKPLTGNSAASNAAIIGLNAFNLAAAATAPWFIFPRLGIGGTMAEIGLIWIPVAFSAAFFTVPALRIPGVLRENARRATRNVRKALLSLVSRSALAGESAGSVSLREAETLVEESLGDKRHRRVDVSKTLDQLVAEFDGEVEVEPSGDTRFRFPGFRTAMAAAHRLRRAIGLEKRVVGRVVYASDDDAAQAGERDLASFDEALAAGSAETLVGDGAGQDGEETLALPPADALQDYLNDPDRLAFRDELQLAALEDQMRREGAGAR